MKEQLPFVIQFSRLEDFCQEVVAQRIDLVRLWTGAFSTGSPGSAYRTVNTQAIDPRQRAVLSLCLVIGVYQELYDKPFGPTAEQEAAIINEHLDEARALVGSYILEHTSAAIRPGMIYTGLTAKTIQRAGWDGFNHIYDAIREVRGEN